MIVIAVLVILSMLLTFDPVANAVAKVTGVVPETLKSWARVVIAAGMGIALIGWGVAALAVPFVGVAMIVIGVVAFAWAVWPLFRPNSVAG